MEELFQEAFDHFEADVSPKAWSNIQNGLQQGAVVPNASSATTVAKATALTTGKMMVAAGAVVVTVAVSTWAIVSFSDDSQPLAQQTPVEEVVVPQNAPKTEQAVLTATPTITKAETTADNNTSPKVSTVNEAAVNAKEALSNADETDFKTTSSSTDGSSPTSGDGAISAGVTNNADPSSTPASVVETDNNASIDEDRATESVKAKEEAPEESPLRNLQVERGTIEASISTTGLKGVAPFEVGFEFEEMGNVRAKGWQWNFNDGSPAAMIHSPFHIFNEAGVYDVVLTLTDGDGIKGEQHISITVEEEIETPTTAEVEINKVMTINGDGINDEWKPFFRGAEATSVYISIMERSGKEVYRSNNLESAWTGRDLDGANVRSGTYFFIVRVLYEDGEEMKKIEKKGAITVLR